MKLHPLSLVLSLAALPLLCVACRETETSATEAARPTAAVLADARAVGVENAMAPAPGILSCGQPSPEQMEALAAAGYRTFVNLRPADEPGTGWEASKAEELGLTYAGISVAGADDVTEENARLLSGILDGAPGPVVVYCRSGNRVGALFALEAYHVDGKTPEEALAVGKAAGLTKLEPAVRAKLGLE